jgi:hypothetical protein
MAKVARFSECRVAGRINNGGQMKRFFGVLAFLSFAATCSAFTWPFGSHQAKPPAAQILRDVSASLPDVSGQLMCHAETGQCYRVQHGPPISEKDYVVNDCSECQKEGGK